MRKHGCETCLELSGLVAENELEHQARASHVRDLQARARKLGDGRSAEGRERRRDKFKLASTPQINIGGWVGIGGIHVGEGVNHGLHVRVESALRLLAPQCEQQSRLGAAQLQDKTAIGAARLFSGVEAWRCDARRGWRGQ